MIFKGPVGFSGAGPGEGIRESISPPLTPPPAQCRGYRGWRPPRDVAHHPGPTYFESLYNIHVTSI